MRCATALAAPALGLAFIAASFACSGADATAEVPAEPATVDDGGSPLGPAEDGGLTSDPRDAAATIEGGGNTDVGDAAPQACPTVKHETVVVAGDSISNGAGGAPFYRTLLVTNDDTKYPAWKGRDLATCWTIDPAADVRKVARGGAVATVPANNDPSDMGVLLNQLKKLPSSLPGPVLVVATIGGNDAQYGLASALAGNLDAAVARFTAGLGAALDEVTAPGRFGTGVKADVYLTNIYDPSGGTGVFTYGPSNTKCGGALGYWPAGTSSKAMFTKWNDAMALEVKKHAGVRLLDMHAAFVAHAVSKPAAANWFDPDCIHPSAAGHDAIRQLFWSALP